MPKFPELSPGAQSVSAAVYSSIQSGSRPPRPPVPLHIGDTWMEPASGCRMEDLKVADHPGMHRYTPVPGLPELRQRIAEFHATRTGVATAAEQVLVVPGATAGLATAVASTIAPGEEVLLSAPYWPLIAGSVRAYNGRPIDVPAMTTAKTAEEIVNLFERHRTEHTAAVYWNTPHNPTGRLMPKAWLEALTEWAGSHQLWVYADEVYEDYVYDGEHCYTRSLAPDITISVHSFSKAYGMAGNRLGYLVAPEPVIAAMLRVMTNVNYSACTASQLAALNALNGPGPAWAAAARDQYAELGRWAADRLGVAAPAGSTFLFIDVADCLDERGLGGFLGDLYQAGVMVAPGPSFGPFPTHIRVCFTCAEPAEVRRGITILAEAMAERRTG